MRQSRPQPAHPTTQKLRTARTRDVIDRLRFGNVTRRELRANLLFLFGFLALSLPGMILLAKKKMDPAAPPMYFPDPVKRRLPYITPLSVPDEVKRYVPERTGQWVAQITSERAGQEVL